MLLAYDDIGPGPVVVLLHGFPFDRNLWAAQASTIGSIYRIIAPDLRGHGDSAAPEGVYTIDEMADDVMDLLDALHLREPVVIGGQSMGGYVALSAVLRYPDRFRALMLIDTRAKADTPEAAKSREELAKRVEAADSVEPVVEGMLPRLFAPITRQKHPERIVPIVTAMHNLNHLAAVGTIRGLASRPDRVASLPKITMPTLVLVGAEDVISTPDEMRTIADALPDARYVVIPEAGHLAVVENPEACNTAILAFLNERT